MNGELKNPRHEAFARHYVKHGVARNAYKAAGYKARMPVKLTECAPIDSAAWRLLKYEKVKHRVNALRAAMSKRAEVTEDSLIDELEQARQLAEREGQSGGMVAATMGKAKLAGLLIERKEIGDAGDFARMSAEELRAYITEHTQQQPEPIQTPNAASSDSVN